MTCEKSLQFRAHALLAGLARVLSHASKVVVSGHWPPSPRVGKMKCSAHNSHSLSYVKMNSCCVVLCYVRNQAVIHRMYLYEPDEVLIRMNDWVGSVFCHIHHF